MRSSRPRIGPVPICFLLSTVFTTLVVASATPAGSDTITLVSPTYVNALGNLLPVFSKLTIHFTPEPGTILLLTDGIAVAEAQRTTPEVYELYLRAKQRIYSRVGTQIELAVKELDQALQLDPEYAPVYAQRGIATMLLSDQQYGSIPHIEANRRGKRFSELALQLDPELAEGWAAMGLYYTRDSIDIQLAIDALAKALELKPRTSIPSASETTCRSARPRADRVAFETCPSAASAGTETRIIERATNRTSAFFPRAPRQG